MDGFFILMLIVAVVAAAVYSSKQRSAARTSWKIAARSLGLTCNDPGAFSNPRIRGALNGYDVNVDVVTRGSGKSRRTYTRYRIHYPSLRLGMRLSKEVPVFTAVTKAFGAQDIEIGHGKFDDDILVTARSARTIRQFLSGKRRSVVHRFLTGHQGAEITDTHASFETRGTETNAITIQRGLTALSRLAMELQIDPEAARVAPEPKESPSDTKPTLVAEPRDESSEIAQGATAVAALPIVLKTREDARRERQSRKKKRKARKKRQRAAQDLATMVGAMAASAEPAPPPLPAPAPEPAEEPIETRSAEVMEPELPADPTPELAVTPEPAEAPDTSAQTALCERLFAGDLRIPDVKALFAETFDGTDVRWTGRLKNVRSYYSDLVFGSEPGTRAEVVVARVSAGMFGERDVSAVVQLPAGMEDELRAHVGEDVTFRGTLKSLDPFMREIHVAEGDLDA